MLRFLGSAVPSVHATSHRLVCALNGVHSLVWFVCVDWRRGWWLQVLGSAANAFTAVCPERLDLLHSQFRRLTALISDVDEWGQIVIINMLLRYSRTQFLNPQDATDSRRSRTMTEDSEDEGACLSCTCSVTGTPSADVTSCAHRALLPLLWAVAYSPSSCTHERRRPSLAGACAHVIGFFFCLWACVRVVVDQARPPVARSWMRTIDCCWRRCFRC